MSQTVKVVGSLKFPLGEDELSLPSPIDLGFALSFGQLSHQILNFDAPVTDSVVGLGTMATGGAKGIFLQSIIGSFSYKFNNDTDAKPMTVQGYTLIVNPVQGWLTGLKITTAAAAKVRMIAFG